MEDIKFIKDLGKSVIFFATLAIIAGIIINLWGNTRYYTREGIVTSTTRETVTVEDGLGMEWELRSTEYQKSDKVTLEVDDNGTDDVRDDVVTKILGRR
jgi:hypothetical protein